jgi:hypothetical protein
LQAIGDVRRLDGATRSIGSDEIDVGGKTVVTEDGKSMQ